MIKRVIRKAIVKKRQKQKKFREKMLPSKEFFYQIVLNNQN